MTELQFVVASGKSLGGRFRGLPGGSRMPVGDETSETNGKFTIGMEEARLLAEHGLGRIVGGDGLVRAPSLANL